MSKHFTSTRHMTITTGAANPAKPVRAAIGKGGGKPRNYPMDSDEAFKKRLKRYVREQAAAEAAAEAALEARRAAAVPA